MVMLFPFLDLAMYGSITIRSLIVLMGLSMLSWARPQLLFPTTTSPTTMRCVSSVHSKFFLNSAFNLVFSFMGRLIFVLYVIKTGDAVGS